MKRFVNIFTRFCAVAFVAAIILPACTKGTPVAETIQKESNPYLIPLDKALESLNGFLQSEDLTKAGGQMREIESVSTIRSRSIATRSGIDINDNEELLYVVNFKNNLGYAVLAADSRLQDKIIAVTEAGKLNPSLFDKPQTKFVNHVAVLDGYKMRYTTTTTYYYLNGILDHTTTTDSSCAMIHCDFGWKTDNNGYFVSGLFNLGGSDAQYDFGVETPKNYNYNQYLKIITYNI